MPQAAHVGRSRRMRPSGCRRTGTGRMPHERAPGRAPQRLSTCCAQAKHGRQGGWFCPPNCLSATHQHILQLLVTHAVCARGAEGLQARQAVASGIVPSPRRNVPRHLASGLRCRCQAATAAAAPKCPAKEPSPSLTELEGANSVPKKPPGGSSSFRTSGNCGVHWDAPHVLLNPAWVLPAAGGHAGTRQAARRRRRHGAGPVGTCVWRQPCAGAEPSAPPLPPFERICTGWTAGGRRRARPTPSRRLPGRHRRARRPAPAAPAAQAPALLPARAAACLMRRGLCTGSGEGSRTPVIQPNLRAPGCKPAPAAQQRQQV